MKLLAKTFALAAVTAVAAENGLRPDAAAEHRRLDDITDAIDTLCGLCSACDLFGPLCSPAAVVDFACANCATLDVTGLCEACTACSSIAGCDANAVATTGCGICPTDDGGTDNGVAEIVEEVCFSEVATVQVLGSKDSSTPMKDLKVGDHVLTADGSYQPVYAFGHHHPTIKASFFQIHSKNAENALEVTANHLIFLQDHSSPVPAQDIKVGDVLRGGDDGLKVTKVGTVERAGIYAPLTTGGTVVVDGVTASSYIRLHHKTPQKQLLSDHDLIHVALSPYRLLCNGVSEAFCDTKYYLNDGMPFYAHYGLELLNFLLNSHVVVSSVGMSFILLLTGACQVLENLFGASLAPLMVFLAVVGYVSHSKKNSHSKRKAL